MRLGFGQGARGRAKRWCEGDSEGWGEGDLEHLSGKGSKFMGERIFPQDFTAD